MEVQAAFNLSVFLLLGVMAGAQAAPFQNEHFSLDVPRGYEGPHYRAEPEGPTYILIKRHLPTSKTALFQVVVHELGKGKRVQGDDLLNKFLNGIRRKRIELVAEPIEDAVLDAGPARVARWKGMLDGKPLVGRMYVAVRGATAYVINIQDFEEYSYDSMPVMERMIRSTRLVPAGAARAGQAGGAKPATPAPAFRAIEPEELGGHIESRVRITLKDGRVREGMLVSADGESAVVSVDSAGMGMLAFTIPFKTMTKAEVRKID